MKTIDMEAIARGLLTLLDAADELSRMAVRAACLKEQVHQAVIDITGELKLACSRKP